MCTTACASPMPGDDVKTRSTRAWSGKSSGLHSNAYGTALMSRVGALPERARADALDAQ